MGAAQQRAVHEGVEVDDRGFNVQGDIHHNAR